MQRRWRWLTYCFPALVEVVAGKPYLVLICINDFLNASQTINLNLKGSVDADFYV
jgi:hypothetical protein